MLKGMIVKGIGGFYYVKTDEGVIECRARGVFRKDKITPLVGDQVEIRISSEDNSGYVENILKRSSELIRPPVANVNHALIVFAARNPDPNLWLLDRFLLLAEYQNLDITLSINKVDLTEEGSAKEISSIYKKAGYRVIETSTKLDQGIDQVMKTLKDKITVLAGPSGVGKSTLLNHIQPNLKLTTGELSHKNKRGKHTTRTAELMELDIGGWVVDTPGFSSLDINYIEEEELSQYFKDINDYSDNCRFIGCRHDKEPDCSVKEAVTQGKISKNRYENYLKFYKELAQIRRY